MDFDLCETHDLALEMWPTLVSCPLEKTEDLHVEGSTQTLLKLGLHLLGKSECFPLQYDVPGMYVLYIDMV